MSDIDLFKHHLSTGIEKVPFSFMARGVLFGRDIGYRVDAHLNIPVLDDTEPFASGLFVTDGESFEKDFRRHGNRIFEPFEAASPEYPEREAYGLEKLKRILGWHEEPRAGASAHPLARLDFALEDDEEDQLDRVLAPQWSWHGRGPVWKSTPFYQRMAPPPPQLVKNGRFIGRLAPIPDRFARQITQTDAYDIIEAAQSSVEAETAIINGRLWVETSMPFIHIRQPTSLRPEVALAFAHDDPIDQASVCFSIGDLAEAIAFASSLGCGSGDLHLCGRLDSA